MEKAVDTFPELDDEHAEQGKEMGRKGNGFHNPDQIDRRRITALPEPRERRRKGQIIESRLREMMMQLEKDQSGIDSNQPAEKRCKVIVWGPWCFSCVGDERQNAECRIGRRGVGISHVSHGRSALVQMMFADNVCGLDWKRLKIWGFAIMGRWRVDEAPVEQS